VDVRNHASYRTEWPGTSDTGTAAEKIDYLVMSRGLRAKLMDTGIKRRGTFHPHLWQPFDTVTKPADKASDHHLVWAAYSL
jgi:hypothetical protein